MSDVDGNAYLLALTVTPGSFSPPFNRNTTGYAVDVASNVTSVTVSATKAHVNAVISGDLAAASGTGTGKATIQLQPPGVNTPVTIYVTGPGIAQRTYTVNVTRAALSGNNNLSALKLTPGVLAPAFSPSIQHYTVDVASATDHVVVSATKADTHAVMSDKMNAGAGVPTGQKTILLNEAGRSTSVAITVTAQNGNSKTYSITVNRAVFPQLAEVTPAPQEAKRKGTNKLDRIISPTPPSPASTSEVANRSTVKAPRAMSSIMISYRRDDSSDVTGRIYDRLVRSFGQKAVFKDVDSIPIGFDFRTKLNEVLSKCDVFLAVIGQNWVKKRGSKGKSRLENPEDFVRIEIEAALKRKIPVIPLLVSGAVIPSADKLPPSIKDLVFRHGVTVRPDPDFHGDMKRLINNLKRQIEEFEKHRIG
jgi:hypothetical protein